MRLPTKRRCTATHSSFGNGNGELNPGTRTVRKSVKLVVFRVGDFVACVYLARQPQSCVANVLSMICGSVAEPWPDE